MSTLDSFYTPTILAQRLVNYITVTNVSKAIDFCIGDGDLLRAVIERYNNVQIYGTDVDNDAIQKLSVEFPNWSLHKCDFKNDESVNQVPFLEKSEFDLIMLNPPFTCKGSVVESIIFKNNFFKVSTAMYFLLKALHFLSSIGGLYAILPISSIYSQKDRAAWEYLRRTYNVCILEEPTRISFSNKCSPNIALVYVGNYEYKKQEIVEYKDYSSLPVTDIIRGCIRMQNLNISNNKDAVKLIHTTNIKNGRLTNLRTIKPSNSITISGHGVVIPRVCNPSPSKIAILDGAENYYLSDCVIVLRTNTKDNAREIRKYILTNWNDFKRIYKGTGAQYTTIERLKEIFYKNKGTSSNYYFALWKPVS